MPHYGKRRASGTTVKKMFRFIQVSIVVATLLAAQSMAFAESQWEVLQPIRFMVSGVLRKNGTPNVDIKPIQAIFVAKDAGTAVKMLSTFAGNAYPGYELIATLASRVPASAACANSI